MKKLSMAVVALVFASGMNCAQAAYVMTAQGQRVDGTDIRAKPDGEITLTVAGGSRTFLKGQYTQAVADKPADYDKAKQLLAAKQYDEAIKILNDIAMRYRYLQWDNAARMLIAQAYAQKGDFPGAMDAYDKLFAYSPRSKEDPTVQVEYCRILLLAQQYDKLMPMLNTMIAGADRSTAAKAQVIRGDVYVAQNQLENAVLDYLRTVLLFEAEKDSQPEALYKAASTLETLRDARAPKMYAKLKALYPGSPYAAKAK